MNPRPRTSDLRPAQERMGILRDIAMNNAPIAAKAGNVKRATLDRTEAASLKAAMAVLAKHGVKS